MNNNLIKLFATDVDGVLTDAGMYYTEKGDELKKFNTHDGMGIHLIKNDGIKTAILTSENTKIVENRAKKLKIDYVFQGVKNKLKTMLDLCKKLDIEINNVAYIGDDINDLELLKAAGVKACPNDAVDKIKNIENIHILSKNGGYGAVREFCDMIIDINDRKGENND
ncbi:MAG: HAD-IIIA family hydrolase [Spirochaetes bacterium]|nr:HAD-IIIA family hydrolase [Spirochaetota bacterium]